MSICRSLADVLAAADRDSQADPHTGRPDPPLSQDTADHIAAHRASYRDDTAA